MSICAQQSQYLLGNVLLPVFVLSLISVLTPCCHFHFTIPACVTVEYCGIVYCLIKMESRKLETALLLLHWLVNHIRFTYLCLWLFFIIFTVYHQIMLIFFLVVSLWLCLYPPLPLCSALFTTPLPLKHLITCNGNIPLITPCKLASLLSTIKMKNSNYIIKESCLMCGSTEKVKTVSDPRNV